MDPIVLRHEREGGIMMPTFLMIGAAKSGSSALWTMLRQHPDICMATRKEPNFFSAEQTQQYSRGPGDGPYVFLDLAGYRALFSHARGETAIGEASNSTLYFPPAAERVKALVPDAQIVAVLRQPADRAYSAYMHLRRDGREPLGDFAEALAHEDRRIRENWSFIWHYRSAGLYHRQLKRFYERFDRDRIKIILHDELRADPRGVIADLFAFLGVDSAFEPAVDTTVNRSGLPKLRFARSLTRLTFDRPNPLRYFARRFIREDIRTMAVQYIRSRNVVPQTIPPDIRRSLTESFRPDIERLQDLIDRNLSHWLA